MRTFPTNIIIMKFKGTQGNWKVFRILTDLGWWFKVSSSETINHNEKEAICNIITRNSERAEANAKLIAAAPDMLNTLIIIKDLYDTEKGQIHELLTNTINKAI